MKSGIVHKYVTKIAPCCFYCRMYGCLCTRLQCVAKTEILIVANEEVVLQVGVNTDKTEYSEMNAA